MAVDAVAEHYGFGGFSNKFHAQSSSGSIGETKLLCMKPDTFMNLSGQAVGEALRFYKGKPEDMLVIHDELDLPLGKVQLKQGGGAAGHNGLKNIDRHIGKDYWRVRVGIDHPGDRDRVSDYVLSNFTNKEKSVMEPIIDAIAAHINLALEGEKSRFIMKIGEELGGV
jgi:PTH1 family peptidyl-tRNA hydrolase